MRSGAYSVTSSIRAANASSDGELYYSEDCVANVLSLGNAVDSSYKIRYLASHDEFLLQMTEGGRTYIFHRNVSTNTYVCNLESDVADSVG